MKIQKTKSGFYFYNERPTNTRLAKICDFYKDDKLILNKPFLVKSYHYNKFWCYRTNKNFPYPNSNFTTFLNDNRVFIYADK